MFNLKIFLVEDEYLIAKLLTRQLEDLGHEVVGLAANAAAALEKIPQTEARLLILDIRLAGSMDGIETLRRIRTDLGISTPAVFLTGYDDEDTRKNAQSLNPLAYFIKPLDLSSFQKLLQDSFPNN